MTNQTLIQTKNSLWNEIKELLESEENKEILKEYDKNNKIEKQDLTKLNISSNNPNPMLDDVIGEKILYSYMPTSYDNMIDWTKEEPLLIASQILPHFYKDENGILPILRGNILNYLKRFVYREIEGWLKDLKK